MFRISRNGQEPVVDVAQVEEIEPAIRSSKPGRYHIDQIERDAPPSGLTSRRWGVGIKQRDGSIVIEPDPWQDSTHRPSGSDRLQRAVVSAIVI